MHPNMQIQETKGNSEKNKIIVKNKVAKCVWFYFSLTLHLLWERCNTDLFLIEHFRQDSEHNPQTNYY